MRHLQLLALNTLKTQTITNTRTLTPGRIAERGTHEQLLSQGGIYSELMSSQGMIIGSSV